MYINKELRQESELIELERALQGIDKRTQTFMDFIDESTRV
jgi:hypothetical protein